MITFAEACDQVGYYKVALRPEEEFVFFGYRGGEVQEFKTRDEALAFSCNVERVVKNIAEIKAFDTARRELRHKAEQVWHEALVAEYPDISPAQFDVLYNKAYDDAHHHGYDACAAAFDELYCLCIAFADLVCKQG